jgi:hypothetical protein
MEGAGSRAEQNRPMQGMTLRLLKKHMSLISLAVIMGVAVTFVGAYCIRQATRAPDVSWRKKPEAYEAYRDKQYKFLNVAKRDFSTACQAPKYKDD